MDQDGGDLIKVSRDDHISLQRLHEATNQSLEDVTRQVNELRAANQHLKDQMVIHMGQVKDTNATYARILEQAQEEKSVLVAEKGQLLDKVYNLSKDKEALEAKIKQLREEMASY